MDQILGFIATLLFSIMYIPQIYVTWKTGSIKNVSFSMFLIGFIANIVALVYASLIHQLPLQIKYIIALFGIGVYIIVYIRAKLKNTSSELGAHNIEAEKNFTDLIEKEK